MKQIINLLFLITTISFAQLQSPTSFLGYELGTQFSRHGDVVRYFEHVAANSEMVTYQFYGKTNERRPLSYAVISSPENLKNIEQIRLANLQNAGLASGSNTKAEKAIIWLSYNVHGNEASSTEAAMNTVYKLITEKQDWLENTVIIMDPCVNPDGRDRYANFYNEIKATPYNADPNATEHSEPWPGGRPNHYLFDLNRDWAWATQVESQQRLAVYNKWMPHVHVDFHEQGINEPYYFAPAAEPYHEIITPFQRQFQTEIGQNHAQYFDKQGRLFFTRERFDLLYPSYGDTYPTYMGAIGMTYEKGGHGRAGLGIINDESHELTLTERMEDHTTTGLSTVEISSKNADRLNTEFKKYFSDNNTTNKSFVMQGNADKIKALADLLDRHEIKYGYVNGSVSGISYTTGKKGSMQAKEALVVSTDQPKGKMVQALFESNPKLTTPLTYDITSWSLPYAYGLESVATTALVKTNFIQNKSKQTNVSKTDAAGYILNWQSMDDARFMTAILKAGIKVRFSEKPIQFQNTKFNRGALIITRSDNFKNTSFDDIVTSLANKYGRILFASNSSFADSMTDFGSPDIKLINNPKIAMLQGQGTSSLSYGALWHFFEQQLQFPISSINTSDFSTKVLSKYNVLVMPDGYYNSLNNDNTRNDLKTWIRNGGKIVAFSDALQLFAGKEGFSLTKKDADKKDDDKDKKDEDKASEIEDLLIPYSEREASYIPELLTGSIFKVKMDTTHPLGFGYDDTYFSLKLGSTSYELLKKGYNVGYIKGKAETMGGFVGEEALKKQENTMIFGEENLGSGSIIYFVDDVLFRSFWENGKLMFVNSLFFVNNNSFEL